MADNQEDEAEERFLREAREKREKEKRAREQAIKRDAAAAKEAQRKKEPPRDPRVDGGEHCDLRDLETFLTSPTPRHVGTVHCYVVRKAKGAMKLYPEYRLYLKFGKKFLLAAKKKTMNRTSNYMITMSENVLVGNAAEKESVGKLRSNTWGTEFVTYDKGLNPTKNQSADASTLRKELCAVTYAQNILGTKGPRKMKVAVPQVGETLSALLNPNP